MPRTAPQTNDAGPLTQQAMTVLRARYLRKNAQGAVVETPAQMFRRVASNIAEAERRYRTRQERGAFAARIETLMRRLTFLPNSPTLMNAGAPLQQLAACFVLPVEDSLPSIYDTLKHQALIHQSGGGTGFTFTHLRPKNDAVASTHGIASGPLSFMRIFNASTEVIKQGGTRRGANMGILRVDHPDILEFIQAKRHPQDFTNFNLSVGLTDAFMRAVRRGTSYPLINPHTKKVIARPAATKVFEQLVDAAWMSGEPGVLFVDTIERAQPTPVLGPIEATNPCGEQPLLPYESCVLGSINVAQFVTRSAQRPMLDYDRLAAVIPDTVRFLDNVIDMNRFPLPAIERLTRANRKIGLGIMGFADLLLALDIPYDTDDAVRLGRHLMGFLQAQAHEASAKLARVRGAFPNYARSRLAAQGTRRRNATVTTIAPTGTLSVLANCSAGIEPLYGVSFTRIALGDHRFTTLHPDFERRARTTGIWSDQLVRELAAHESIQHLTQIPADLRRLFVTAHDVSPAYHVRMQAAFQQGSDSGVSKTINLPPHATRDDVAAAFLLAHRLKCKGLTVFRSGSREAQVLSCATTQSC